MPAWLARAFTTAAKHYQAGLHAEAQQLLIAILEREPRHSDSLYLLGSIAAMGKDLVLAEDFLRQALAIESRKTAYWVLFGNILQQASKLEASADCYKAALALDAHCADAYYNWGNTLERQGRNKDAIACFETTLRLLPHHIQARNNLANQYRQGGRYEEAVAHLEQARREDPTSMPVVLNLGNAYMAMERYDDAIACFDAAIQLAPQASVLYNNKGNTMRTVGRVEEALACYRTALAIDPDRAELHVNLAMALQMQGRMKEALISFRHALALAPEYATASGAALFTLHYDPDLSTLALRDAHVDWATRYAVPLDPGPRTYSRDKDPERELRIGFVSADLRQHPVSFFTAPLLESLNRSQYAATCYFTSNRTDQWTARVRQAAVQWREASGTSDVELAEMIEADGIDILIDLAGHTAGNRLLAFARRPAPVQMSWLGYFNTTGMAAMDYLVVDHVLAPAEEQAPFVEKPLRLKGCYLNYVGPDYAPAVSTLPSAQHGHITYGCFNTLSKVTEDVVALWARVLQAEPLSRLILKNAVLNDGLSRQLYWEMFERAGIRRHRVDLLGEAPHQELLKFYSHVDIALDPFPYNGGTTTCEALWMGVPVVSWAGDRFVSRVGATILTHAGHPEWIARSAEDYIAKAASLARDRDGLAAIRGALRPQVQHSTLGDTVQYTRNWEDALRSVWRDWASR